MTKTRKRQYDVAFPLCDTIRKSELANLEDGECSPRFSVRFSKEEEKMRYF